MAFSIGDGTAAAGRWAKGLLAPGPRMIDELECVASVLLAIVFGHLAGAHHIAWAAFSGYMVMRGHVAETLQRGALRIVGTGCGALLAVGFVTSLGLSPWIVMAGVAFVGGVTLYAALTARHSYAWLFVGLTFVMVVLDQLEHPGASLRAFAWSRFVEVAAGTVACVLVSLISTYTVRRRWPAIRRPNPPPAGWRPDAARHSVQAALALAAIPWLQTTWDLPELGGGAVSIMALMMAPLAAIGHSAFRPVSHRMAMRVIGGIIGAAFAAAVLVASHGHPALLLAGAAVGVMAGRHIENGASAAAYAGTQFTLSVLMALVPDSYAQADVTVGWLRLLGTLIGVALLIPVLGGWHLVARGKPAADTDARGEAGDI